MSQENVELVRGCLEAWRLGDEATALNALAPDIEINLVGAAVGHEVFHGHEGVREAVEGFDSAWQRTEFEFGDLLEAGDHVVVPFTHRLRGRASGIDVVARYSAVFTVRDGKIVRFRDFASHGAALETWGCGSRRDCCYSSKAAARPSPDSVLLSREGGTHAAIDKIAAPMGERHSARKAAARSQPSERSIADRTSAGATSGADRSRQAARVRSALERRRLRPRLCVPPPAPRRSGHAGSLRRRRSRRTRTGRAPRLRP